MALMSQMQLFTVPLLPTWLWARIVNTSCKLPKLLLCSCRVQRRRSVELSKFGRKILTTELGSYYRKSVPVNYTLWRPIRTNLFSRGESRNQDKYFINIGSPASPREGNIQLLTHL